MGVEYGVGRPSAKGAVTPLSVEVIEVVGDRRSGFCHALVGAQVDLLVLQAPPQPFDEHVVEPAALDVHRDRHVVLLENAREGLRGELGSLIGIEDLRCPIHGNRLLKSLHAEVSLQRVRDAV